MQFTITYRDRYGLKFAVIDADSVESAKFQVCERSPAGVTFLTIRENNPPLATVTGL